MMNRRTLGSASLALLLASSMALGARGADIFIDPSGANDLLTFTNAIAAANAGDTIYVHGGTYEFSSRLTISKSGGVDNPIKIFAVPGEAPILDFSGMSASLNGQTSGRGVQFNEASTWWHVKGLTIQNARDNGLYNGGSHSVFEQVVTRVNGDSGFQLHDTASFNQVINCDSYDNYDSYTVNGSGQPAPGENADGFAVKDPDIGVGNVFRGNRAWGNSDDGWDTFDAVGSGVLIQDSWAFDNGFNNWGVANFAGDGTGYKLGQDGGDHVLNNVLAIDNAGHGIDINANGTGVKVFNSTSFSNNKANWYFDETAAQTQNLHILQNNISLSGAQSDVFQSGVSSSFNTWNGGPFAANSGDFVSTTRVVSMEDLLKLPRQEDGSLPDIGGFLKLASDSNLINVGTPVSFIFGGVTYDLPYIGVAPDLGAFEFVPSTGLMGDYNNNDVVDAADYTVWRDTMAGGGSLLNDPTPESVSESDFTYWREHFGATSGGGAGSASVVPEPGSIALAFCAFSLLLIYLPRR